MKSSFFRFASNFNAFLLRSSPRIFLRPFHQAWIKHQKQVLISGGGGTMLAWTLFGKSDKEESKTAAEPAYKLSLPPDVQAADTHYKYYALDSCYRLLAKYEDKTEEPEILWRLARVIHDLGKNETDPEKRKQKIYKSLKLVEKALQNEGSSGNWAAHKWYAIILNAVGEIEGTKSLIKKANEIKTHLERALELNPYDATTWHVLGVWHFSAADLPGYKRAVAKAIFGSPPTSTYEEALHIFEKAEELDPGFYKANLYYMGETLERLGRKEEAKQCFIRAFAVPMYSKDDYDTHVKVGDKLKTVYKIDDDKLPVGNAAVLNYNKEDEAKNKKSQN